MGPLLGHVLVGLAELRVICLWPTCPTLLGPREVLLGPSLALGGQELLLTPLDLFWPPQSSVSQKRVKFCPTLSHPRATPFPPTSQQG